MSQTNSNSILVTSMKAIYAALYNRRNSVKTEIVDQKIVGAVASRSNVVKSKAALSLKANKTHASLMHYIQKAGNGSLSLHTLFPFQDVSLNRKGTGINTVGIFVSVPASSGEYEKTVSAKQDAPKSLAYSNGNIAAMARLFASDKLNGADIRNDFTAGYIPTLHTIWDAPYFEKSGEHQLTVGKAINLNTLKVWLNIQNISDNEKFNDADREEKYELEWQKYQALVKLWISKGYIDLSTVAYAKTNAVKPDVAAYLGTNAPADELNVQKILGTADGLTSSEPQMNEGNFHAIILDDEIDEFNKHHFGIFKLATLTADNMETLTDPDEISKTPEIASRSILIFDGAGRQLKARARIADQTYGATNTPVKSSRAFYNLAVGSIVHIQGNISFRTMKEGSQAIVVEIEAEDYMASGNNQNMISGDVSSTEIDLDSFTLSDPDSDFLSALEDDNNVGNPADVVPTNTQTDDEMNN